VGVGGAEDYQGGSAGVRHHHLPSPPSDTEAMEEARLITAYQGPY
jgi:hypothetical protein